MRAESPVLPSRPNLKEVVFAEDQPEYLRLPAVRSVHGAVTSRFHLTWMERLAVVLNGDVWVTLLTFKQPLQPLKVSAIEPTLGEITADEHDQFYVKGGGWLP